ncbi:MAG: T9SS type A sorting domain-containing protein, partial [Ignavibacteriota bacterium]
KDSGAMGLLLEADVLLLRPTTKFGRHGSLWSGHQEKADSRRRWSIHTYPNPSFSNELSIEIRDLPESHAAKVRIYDMLGRVMYLGSALSISENIQSAKVNTRDFLPGNYVVEISSDEGDRVERNSQVVQIIR